MAEKDIIPKEVIDVHLAIHLPFGIEFGPECASLFPDLLQPTQTKQLIVSKKMADEGIILRETLPILQKCVENNIPIRLAPNTIREVLGRRKLDKDVCTRIAREWLCLYTQQTFGDVLEEMEISISDLLSDGKELAIVKKQTCTYHDAIRIITKLRMDVRWITCDITVPDFSTYVSNNKETYAARFIVSVHALIKRLQMFWKKLGEKIVF